MTPSIHRYRSHTCDQLRAANAGEKVRLSGWIARKRDHGGVLFVDLRDNYGTTQIVAPQDHPVAETLTKLAKETVVRVDGLVAARPSDMLNANLSTGEIEVRAAELEILGECSPLPFPVADDPNLSEELRLRYRFLDLRSDKLHRNILVRSQIITSIRRRMTEQGFTEFQTPILTSSSPEGARDYIVPARRHPGKFYALPQAPQQFKQLLMVAGFDRYFQIAPCFRDEDARADRSPGEFYQLDLEMSFATQDDVFHVVEQVLAGIFTEFGDKGEVSTPFLRLPYAEAMLRYGTDKPDLRIPLQIVDLSDTFEGSSFRAFAGKVVRALRVPGGASKPRSWFDRSEETAKRLGAAGLAWLTRPDETTLKGPIGKFLSDEERATLEARCELQVGDALFLVADADAQLPCRVLGRLRVDVGHEFDLVDESIYRFSWITDFPMYERDETTGKVEFSHNPFSMPSGGLEALLHKNPLDILAQQYDLVCDGYELSSGAVRNHEPDLMYKAFEIAGYDRSTVDDKFPALQNAFRYGAPPHAGLAPGIDRIVMLLTGEKNIREVIAFPMNQQAQDLMMNAPGEVTDTQLTDVHIRVVPPPED